MNPIVYRNVNWEFEFLVRMTWLILVVAVWLVYPQPASAAKTDLTIFCGQVSVDLLAPENISVRPNCQTEPGDMGGYLTIKVDCANGPAELFVEYLGDQQLNYDVEACTGTGGHWFDCEESILSQFALENVNVLHFGCPEGSEPTLTALVVPLLVNETDGYVGRVLLVADEEVGTRAIVELYVYDSENMADTWLAASAGTCEELGTFAEMPLVFEGSNPARARVDIQADLVGWNGVLAIRQDYQTIACGAVPSLN